MSEQARRTITALSERCERYEKQIATLNRQRDLAVDAATKARNGALQAASVCSKKHPVYGALLNMADVIDATLSTIKESDGKHG